MTIKKKELYTIIEQEKAYAFIVQELSRTFAQTLQKRNISVRTIKREDISGCTVSQNAVTRAISLLRDGHYLNTISPDRLQQQCDIASQILSFATNYEPHKNIDSLIEAFNTFANDCEKMPILYRIEIKKS